MMNIVARLLIPLRALGIRKTHAVREFGTRGHVGRDVAAVTTVTITTTASITMTAAAFRGLPDLPEDKVFKGLPVNRENRESRVYPASRENPETRRKD